MKRLLGKWNSLGTATSFTAAVARLITYSLLLFLAFECVTIDFRWPEQAVLGVLTIAITFAIHRYFRVGTGDAGADVRLDAGDDTVCVLAVFTVVQALRARNHPIPWIDMFFMLILLSAEVLRVCHPLSRIHPDNSSAAPAACIRCLTDVEEWPHVDVLIPTYNEPLSVVRSTAFAAMNIDYPAGKNARLRAR